ncbi:MAG: hypothetical protein HC937_03505 [Aquincola sp.]|nr:hypothetical protein [Aquincola sp.]
MAAARAIRGLGTCGKRTSALRGSAALARAEGPTTEFDGARYHLDYQDQAKLADGKPGDGLAEFTLQGETVSLKGAVDVETGFLVPDSPYGDIAAQTSASDRAMRMLAKRIADDIRLKFAAK